MGQQVQLKTRAALFWIGAASFAIFGLCEFYLTKIQPLGPCLSSGLQLIALLLGIAGFCVGAASLVAWAIWTVVRLFKRRRQPEDGIVA
jgi:uncharacterized iron-regulated membrane protein